MSNDMVCLDSTSISMCRNGVDISCLHALTFSLQIIAFDDHSHKNTQKALNQYNLGKISMLRIMKHLRERAIGDAGSRSFNGRGVCASWIVCAGS